MTYTPQSVPLPCFGPSVTVMVVQFAGLPYLASPEFFGCAHSQSTIWRVLLAIMLPRLPSQIRESIIVIVIGVLLAIARYQCELSSLMGITSISQSAMFVTDASYPSVNRSALQTSACVISSLNMPLFVIKIWGGMPGAAFALSMCANVSSRPY